MRPAKRFFYKHLGALALTVLVAACSTTDVTMPEELTEAELYQQANQQLDNEQFALAVETLQTLESRYPFGPFAEQSQLDLIFAYYRNMEPEAARASAERFIRLHPNNPNVDYAYYMRGLASNTADLGLIERYVPVDLSQRDPGQAHQSFNEFAELLRRFPDSRYAPDARQRMISLRNRTARHSIHVANYYMKRKAYVAAINRSRYVVEHLQGTPVVEQALGIMVDGYLRLGLSAPADETLEVLKTNFPNSKMVTAQGEFIGRHSYDDVDPSLLSTLTFGLFGNSRAEERPDILEPPKAPEPPKQG